MSYILDALKKSERDRAATEAPGASQILAGEAPPHRRNIGLWIGVIVIVNALALTTLWWQIRSTASVSAAPSVAARPIDRQPAQPAPIAAQPQPTLTTQAEPMPTAPPKAAPTKPVAPEPQATDRAGSSPPGEADTAAKAPSKPPAPAPEPRQPLSPRVTVAKNGPVPLLREFPGRFRRSVPPIHLDVHVYADKPANRFVLVDLKRYHEGDRLQSGVQLEKITEHGMILSYQGTRFRVLVHE